MSEVASPLPPPYLPNTCASCKRRVMVCPHKHDCDGYVHVADGSHECKTLAQALIESLKRR